MHCDSFTLPGPLTLVSGEAILCYHSRDQEITQVVRLPHPHACWQVGLASRLVERVASISTHQHYRMLLPGQIEPNSDPEVDPPVVSYIDLVHYSDLQIYIYTALH